METKARYLLVGTCTILAGLLFAAFLIFSSAKDVQTSQYAVYFKEGVRGLSIGSSVEFNGVQVGTVKDVGLLPEDQSQVRAVLEISSKVVIRDDCVAVLSAQGITGMSSIYITGGSPSSPPLKANAKDSTDPLPVIPEGKSALESVAGGIPEMIASVSKLMDSVNKIFSEENTEQLRQILEATAKITTDLADGDNSLPATLSSLKATSEQLTVFLADADKLLNSDVQKTVVSVQRSFDRLNDLLTKLEPELMRMSATGSGGLSQLLNDTRNLVRDLDKLVRDLNADPQSILFGPNVPEYEPRKGR